MASMNRENFIVKEHLEAVDHYQVRTAWETLGDITEQIVRQALERVEQVAWEVIPQMAETMIREEIRRMKGESDS